MLFKVTPRILPGGKSPANGYLGSATLGHHWVRAQTTPAKKGNVLFLLLDRPKKTPTMPLSPATPSTKGFVLAPTATANIHATNADQRTMALRRARKAPLAMEHPVLNEILVQEALS